MCLSVSFFFFFYFCVPAFISRVQNFWWVFLCMWACDSFQSNHMGGSEKFWFCWKTKKYWAEGTPCLYHACSREDGGLAVGSAVKCRKAIFAYVAKRKSSSCTLYVCWNRVKKKKKFWKFGLRKFCKITAISHPCNHRGSHIPSLWMNVFLPPLFVFCCL